MASIAKCIDAAIRQGALDPEEGETLKKRYKELSKVMRSEESIKEALAQEIGAEAAERERRAHLMETKRKVIIDTLTGYRNLKGEADLAEAYVALHENFGRAGTFIQDAEGLRDVIRRQALGELADLLRAFRKGVWTGDLRRSLTSVAADLRLVVRELFGENTGDARAKAMAAAFTQVAEKLRVRFNEAGGGIGKLDRWGLPQGHAADALLDYGRARWVEYMMGADVLDRERTVHPLTRRRLSDNDLRESLGVIWDRITTDGWSDREITGAGVGRGALWSQHADHRFLHFKDADAWLAYAKSFGNPDPFSAMMHHIDVMARDIAHMETFGPNPNVQRAYMAAWLKSQAVRMGPTATVIGEQTARLKELSGQLTKPDPDFERMSDRVGAIHVELDAIRRKSTPQLGGKPSQRNKARLAALDRELIGLEQRLAPYWDDPSLQTVEDQATRTQIAALLEEMRDPVLFAQVKDPLSYLRRQLDWADAMWQLQRGGLEPASRAAANVLQSTRNIISSSTLGMAWLSSLSDPVFGQSMRLSFGMGLGKSNVGRVLALVMRDMVTMMDRDTAVRARLGLDSALQTMHRTAKESRTFDGRAWTGFITDRVLTWGLLSPWTQAGKHLAGLDLMGFLADLKETAYTNLPRSTQDALAAHGFDAAAWDAVRQADVHEPKRGARLLRPQEIEAVAGQALAERYLGMILRETRRAVPEATVASRAVMSGGARPGSLMGEAWKSFGQFKGFGMAVVMLWAGQMAREALAGDRSVYGRAAALLITSAFLGGIIMALKDIAAGRDPRKWLDEKTYLDPAFWGAAVLQAGGLGIYGDFLFSNTGRNNQDLSKTIAGPLVDRVDKLLGGTVGNTANLMRGKKTHYGRDLARGLADNMPGGNLLWTNLLFKRAVANQLQRLLDPEADAAFRRDILLRRNDYRQDYWWPPGKASPDRAPDLSRILQTR